MRSGWKEDKRFEDEGWAGALHWQKGGQMNQVLHQSTAASTWWYRPRPHLGWVKMAVCLSKGPSNPEHSPYRRLVDSRVIRKGTCMKDKLRSFSEAVVIHKTSPIRLLHVGKIK